MTEEKKVEWKPKKYARIFASDQEEIFERLGDIQGEKAFVIWFRISLAAVNANSEFFPVSTQAMQRGTGYSRNTIFKAVKNLEQIGFMEVVRKKKDGQSQNEINQFKLLRGSAKNSKKIEPPLVQDPGSDSRCKIPVQKVDGFLHPSSLSTNIKEGGLRPTSPLMIGTLNKEPIKNQIGIPGFGGRVKTPSNPIPFDLRSKNKKGEKPPDYDEFGLDRNNFLYATKRLIHIKKLKGI